MQLYILDKDPQKSAQYIPDKYKFKMLVELGQLICSAGLSDVYKAISQGKELQQWILKYKRYIYWYFAELLRWSKDNIKAKQETIQKLQQILTDLHNNTSVDNAMPIVSAYFRYAKEYNCEIPSKTLLPIDECIKQYNKYLQWKLG